MIIFKKISEKIWFKIKDRGYLFLSRIIGNEYLSMLVVFLFFLVLNSIIYLTVSNVSSSDDQWFYTKIAYLLRTQGWSAITNFQGAYFTDLSQSGYSYGVGLYHYFLVPFTFISDKILGLKLSGLFFASLVPAITYWVLRKFNTKNPLIWVVLFLYVLGSFNFTFRLFLNRPFVLIDALILVEIYLISQKKYWALFAVSLIHTWWHPASFWLPIMLVVCFEAIEALHQKKYNYKNIVASIAGSLGAFLLFPSHSHTFLSPLNPLIFGKKLFSFVYGLGSGPKLIEGSENYKGDIFSLVIQSNAIFAFLVFFIVLNVILYIYKRRNEVHDLDKDNGRVILREYIFLVTIIFFLGYIFSKRFEDLLVPLVMLGSAISFQALIENKYLIVNNSIFKKVLLYSFFIFIIVAGGNRILDMRNTIGSNDSHLKYERAGNWLKENTQKGDIVFNTDFGQFNRLFFYDDWNHYIVGMEPKNMYEYSHKYYWLWHNISLYGIVNKEEDAKEQMEDMTKGKNENELSVYMIKNSKEIANIIKTEFDSRYVFFDGNTFLRKELEKNSDDFDQVYKDEESGIYIYKIK
jgi:hypothetical protein